KLGYRKVRQKGSHVRMFHPDGGKRQPLTIPVHHKELGRGLVRKLCRDANVTPAEFAGLL
ncbi:MAG: type II toxin-antitoxin system HicA family toxin, partial [Elusimicrobiota bacterium]